MKPSKLAPIKTAKRISIAPSRQDLIPNPTEEGPPNNVGRSHTKPGRKELPHLSDGTRSHPVQSPSRCRWSLVRAQRSRRTYRRAQRWRFHARIRVENRLVRAHSPSALE